MSTSSNVFDNPSTRIILLQLHVRSPHRNSTFQKLFSLPHEEFLIADYACSLKRKLPLQVKLFEVAISFSLPAFTMFRGFLVLGQERKLCYLWMILRYVQNFLTKNRYVNNLVGRFDKSSLMVNTVKLYWL
jgi:hypothetical protein